MIKTITIAMLFWLVMNLTFRVEALEQQMIQLQQDQNDDVTSSPDTPQLAFTKILLN